MSIFSFSKNTFEGQLPDENVVSLLRRHWFVLAGWTIFSAILFFLPFVISSIFEDQIRKIGASSVYWFFVSAYWVVVWHAYFYGVMKYFLDVWIVTDHRIIDSHQVGFFNRIVSEMHISKVQDVSTRTAGLIETLLNYGNVVVQTAGEEQRFMFKQVPSPTDVKNIVMRANNKYVRTHPSGAEPKSVMDNSL